MSFRTRIVKFFRDSLNKDDAEDLVDDILHHVPDIEKAESLYCYLLEEDFRREGKTTDWMEKMSIRLSKSMKITCKARAKELGLASIGEYLRYCVRRELGFPDNLDSISESDEET